MKVKDLPNGVIVWKGDEVLGITGSTIPSAKIPEELDNCEVESIGGNAYDYELIVEEEGGADEMSIQEYEYYNGDER